MGCHLWGRTESDMTEVTQQQYVIGASLMVQMIKNLSAMQETWIKSLGQEDPMEKGIAPNAAFLPE